MKLSTKIILPIILISALLILLNGCQVATVPDDSPGFTPGTITGIIAAPCCTTSVESADGDTTSPEYWCYYCEKDWKLQDGVEVVLTYGEDEIATTITNENGEFTFVDVSPGKNYVITAYCPDYDDDRPLVKDVALELVEGSSVDTKITDIVSTSLGLVVDFLVDFTILGPEDIVLDDVIADKPDFKKFPKFRKLITEVVRVLEACQDVNADDDLQYALCRAAEEISGLNIGCGPGYTPPPVVVKYTLTTAANPPAGGTVSGAGTYTTGTVVPVTASPAVGWSFTGWSGDLTGTANPDNVTMNSNKSVTGNFTQDEYTLTVNILPAGALSAGCAVDRSAPGPYNYGDAVTLTSNAAAGWTFDRWEDDLTGSTDPDSVTMNGDRTVDAIFTQDEYTLTVNILPAGALSAGCAVDRSAPGPYNYGDAVTLTSNAAAGWTFDRWEDDLTGSTDPDSVTMNGDRTVDAIFTQDEYTLTVNILPAGALSAGCAVDRSAPGPYNYGDAVTLTSNAAAGWTFDRWEDDLTGSTDPDSVTMNGDRTVDAIFTQDEYTLTVNILPAGALSAGCAVDRSAPGPYNYGDAVTLTSNAAAGWTFDRWEDDLTGSTDPDSVTMNGDRTVDAIFTQDEYTLTVNILPAGALSAGCAVDRSAPGPYNYGDAVTLTSNAAAGWTFDRWEDDLTGSTDPDSVTMNGDRTVDAIFTQDEYTLTVNILPAGALSAGCAVDRSAPGPYNYGDAVTLTSNAAAGWTFDRWEDDLTGSTDPDSVTMNGDRTVDAIFTQDEYTLTVNILPAGALSAGCAVDRSAPGPYNYGDAVTLTSNAAAGWTFDRWEDDLTGSTDPDSVTMNGDRTVDAIFTQDEYTLTVNILPAGALSAGCAVDRSAPGPYNYGDAVTLTSNAAAGWTFDRWEDDLTGSTDPDSVTMNGDRTVDAIFTQDEYTLTVNILPAGALSAGCAVDRSAPGPYNYGDAVTLTSNAAAGWTFDRWEDDLTGSTDPDSVTMNGDRTVDAIFTQIIVIEAGDLHANLASGDVKPNWDLHVWANITNNSSQPFNGYMRIKSEQGVGGIIKYYPSASGWEAPVTIDPGKGRYPTASSDYWLMDIVATGSGKPSDVFVEIWIYDTSFNEVAYTSKYAN